ncbi:hypothetical protein Hanom_Chr03g00246311 [Helianthus anomalus]
MFSSSSSFSSLLLGSSSIGKQVRSGFELNRFSELPELDADCSHNFPVGDE